MPAEFQRVMDATLSEFPQGFIDKIPIVTKTSESEQISAVEKILRKQG